MMRFRATLAYDGTRYAGFQRQANAISVQGEVEAALQRVLGVPTPIIGAGRTDAGVHASGQVIAFDADWSHGCKALLTALNNALPLDIGLLDLVEQPGIHPRYDALSRVYDYSVWVSPVRHPLMMRTSWHVSQALNIQQMNAAARCLVGRHDFATFGRPPKGENTVREVFASMWRVQPSPYGEVLVYRIEATAFLHQMVRRIVSMLVDVGRGWQSEAAFKEAFWAADLRRAGKPAPPQGLVLVAVRYPPPDQIIERDNDRRLKRASEGQE
ncbi:tRNA pseudouridine(38-40) synthase TruA [Aggregatilineales bacterium SYSU G02658]